MPSSNLLFCGYYDETYDVIMYSLDIRVSYSTYLAIFTAHNGALNFP